MPTIGPPRVRIVSRRLHRSIATDDRRPYYAPLARWHAYMRAPSADALRAMLAEDAVFHSPVVHTPQQGRDKVFAYLHAADQVFADTGFAYVREIVESEQTMLEFTAEIDGIQVNGIDIIRWNADGLIEDFKVMVRPLKAVNLLWQKMGSMLESAAGAS